MKSAVDLQTFLTRQGQEALLCYYVMHAKYVRQGRVVG